MEEYGSEKPIASITDDIVFAVYIPPQAAGTRTGVAFDLDEFLFIDLVRTVLTHRLEGAHDVEVAAVVVSRLDRPAIHEDRGDIQACEGDHRTRHILVASAECKHAIHALGTADRLDGIGDDLTGHEGELHPLGAHRDAVADSDDAEDLRHRPRLAERILSPVREIIQPDVAGGQSAVAVGNADDRFGEIVVTETDGTEHGTVRGALDALRDRLTLAWGVCPGVVIADSSSWFGTKHVRFQPARGEPCKTVVESRACAACAG